MSRWQLWAAGLAAAAHLQRRCCCQLLARRCKRGCAQFPGMPFLLSDSLPSLIFSQIFMYIVFFFPSLKVGKVSRHQTDLQQQQNRPHQSSEGWHETHPWRQLMRSSDRRLWPRRRQRCGSRQLAHVRASGCISVHVKYTTSPQRQQSTGRAHQ